MQINHQMQEICSVLTQHCYMEMQAQINKSTVLIIIVSLVKNTKILVGNLVISQEGEDSEIEKIERYANFINKIKDCKQFKIDFKNKYFSLQWKTGSSISQLKLNLNEKKFNEKEIIFWLQKIVKRKISILKSLQTNQNNDQIIAQIENPINQMNIIENKNDQNKKNIEIKPDFINNRSLGQNNDSQNSQCQDFALLIKKQQDPYEHTYQQFYYRTENYNQYQAPVKLQHIEDSQIQAPIKVQKIQRIQKKKWSYTRKNKRNKKLEDQNDSYEPQKTKKIQKLPLNPIRSPLQLRKTQRKNYLEQQSSMQPDVKFDRQSQAYKQRRRIIRKIFYPLIKYEE